MTPYVLLRLTWLGFGNPEYWKGWSERFGFSTFQFAESPLIWIHAVSVGEVQASTPLVDSLFENYPQYRILLTTITPTGADMVRQRLGDKVIHYYLPYDLPHAMTRFINHFKPKLLIVMETELWPNMYHYCHEQGIRILLLNARMTEKSYRGYKRLNILTRKVLSHVSLIAAQSEDDGHRLITLGADPACTHVTGNMKFDVSVPDNTLEHAQSIRRFLSMNRPVWIAASTHEGEDEQVLDAHSKVLKNRPNSLLILAPRHPERFAAVAELSKKSGFKTIRKSEANEIGEEIQVFVLDSLGELLNYYAAADVAFVGGSLVPTGGHNVLEPAGLGIPVITGPNVKNFMEINRLLLESHAERQVQDMGQLSQQVDLLLGDANLRHEMGQAGKEIVDQNKGSTKRIMELITEYLLIG